MLQELTTEYNMKNFFEAAKDFHLKEYSLEGYGEIQSTIYIRDSLQNERIVSIRKKSHEELSEGWSRLAKM